MGGFYTRRPHSAPLQNHTILAHGFDGETGHLEGRHRLMSAYGDYNAAWCDPEALIDFVTVTSAFYRSFGRPTTRRRGSGWRRGEDRSRTSGRIASWPQRRRTSTGFLVPMPLDNALCRATLTADAPE